MRNSYNRNTRLAGATLAMAGLFVSLTLVVPARSTAAAKSPSSGITSLRTKKPADDAANKMRISKAYGNLPMSFEANRGQTDRRVKFLSRGAGYNLFLTRTEATLALYKNEAKSDSTSRSHHSNLSSVVRMKLKGANPRPKIEGLESLQGKSNYLIGNDRAKWHTDIPTFAKVKYAGVYPGIDVVYYGQQRQIEYDFRLAAGADASKIRIAFDGAQNISIDADGNLVLKTSGGNILQHAPVIYQENESGRQSIAGGYVLRGKHEIGFEVSAYDRSKPLVIDPQLVYATYYGGSLLDQSFGVAVDNGGSAYIAGLTRSPDLTLKNAFQGAPNPGCAGGNPPCTDVFITKLNAAGSDIVYSTYLGSNNDDGANAIAVTSDGKACVTGGIQNQGLPQNDFPLKNEFQGNGTVLTFSSRNEDAFLSVLTADGSDLVYSTFFAGSQGTSTDGDDAGKAIAVDSSNKVYIAGRTGSTNLPTKNAFQTSLHGPLDAFIAKFDPSQSGNRSLLYSSYLGGSNSDVGNGVAVDSVGNAYVVGNTFSTDLIVRAPDSLGPIQPTNHGGSDAFVAKIDTNSSGSASLVYSTYFGGVGTDRALAVAVDSSQRAYVTGSSDSATNFPIKNAFQPNVTGAADAFIAKFNANGSALFYSTFLGGAQDDEGRGIAIDSAGNAYVTGKTGGSFPEVNGLPSSINSGNTFITKIEASDATGTTTPQKLYSDTFGGAGTEGNAIALDTKGNVYIAGSAGANLQTQGGGVFQQQPFQNSNHGGSDAFVVKIESTFPDTIGVFRPSTGQFLLRNSNTAGNPDLTLTFGQSGDKPVVGDWSGDGVTDFGFFRSGTFHLANAIFTRICFTCPLVPTITELSQFNFGPSTGLPVAGDWNGDGIDTIGVFSNGTFQLRNSNTAGGADLSFAFGQTGDLPLAGDWNGDGIDTIGVFRPSINTFFLRNSNASGSADISFAFGIAEDLPLAGDWNGDGIDTIGVLRPSVNTFFLSNVNALDPANTFFFNFGQAGDLPLAGDWNGRPDPFNSPNSGVNDPGNGSSQEGLLQTFVTTCSDPDGWHDIATIDFKIAKSDGGGGGVPIALWVQFNENTGLVRFYDPDTQTWSHGEPGSNVVLSSRFAELHLANTTVVGSGPTGLSVQIAWSIVFKNTAVMNNYKQYLKITDDAGLTTGFDKVGSWSVTR